MLQFGTYAKEYFDKTNTLDDLGEVTINAPETEINLPEDVTFEGVTLSLYFKSKSNSTLTFSMNGKTVETVSSGGYRIARIRDIAASELSDIFTVNINGEYSVTYSPMNYCKNVLTPSNATSDEPQEPNTKLMNLVKALYQYSQAANEYFK